MECTGRHLEIFSSLAKFSKGIIFAIPQFYFSCGHIFASIMILSVSPMEKQLQMARKKNSIEQTRKIQKEKEDWQHSEWKVSDLSARETQQFPKFAKLNK